MGVRPISSWGWTARHALPAYADRLDIPMGVLVEDRWVFPRIHPLAEEYELLFCADERGYVVRSDGTSVMFDDHVSLALFLLNNERATFESRYVETPSYGYGYAEYDIWTATGCMPESRLARLADAQRNVLAPLFASRPDRRPPLFIRPECLSAAARERRYRSLRDLVGFPERRSFGIFGSSPLD